MLQDSFNPGFFKHFWSDYGDVKFTVGTSWLAMGKFPPSLNDTNIALIPKKDVRL